MIITIPQTSNLTIRKVQRLLHDAHKILGVSSFLWSPVWPMSAPEGIWTKPQDFMAWLAKPSEPTEEVLKRWKSMLRKLLVDNLIQH